jgi:adenine phosphoribosyltransferase
MTTDELKALVRAVPDFPQQGILFRDITTLIGNGPGLAATVALLAEQAEAAGAQLIAGIEARGFIFGAAVAARLGLGFVPVRKPGKLPVPASRSTTPWNTAPIPWRSTRAQCPPAPGWS